MSAAPDIFLSYNREDVAVAKAYADAFAGAGLEVWWDATLRSGEAYDRVTEAALRGAKAVVVLWSPRSVESRWVRAEATIADRNRTLMPVTIEPCERPVMFELTQTAELSHWRGEAEDKAWQAFLGDVRKKVGRSEPVPAAVPGPATASAGRGTPSKVAVLPITHRGDDGDMELLAEDLTEDVTRELAQNNWFEVIASGRMAAWRGKTVDYETLGRQLDVRYLVESKLQRSGDTVRLTVQIIDGGTSGMVWSQRFACKAEDLAAAPEKFPSAIAAELGAQLTQFEMNRAMTKPEPLSGWDHLLRCLNYQALGGSASQPRAIEEARQAVSAVPDLGLAHAMLAATLNVQFRYGGVGIDDAPSQEIQTHVTLAMQLDGNNPGVFRILAAVYSSLGDGESALRLARRAAEQLPNSPVAYSILGQVNMENGRIVEAIAAYRHQIRLSSNDPVRFVSLASLGMGLFLEGQAEEAEEALDRSLALNPDFHLALKWKAIVAAHRGKGQMARAAISRLREVESGMPLDQHLQQLGRYQVLADRMAEPIAALRRLWDATGGDG